VIDGGGTRIGLKTKNKRHRRKNQERRTKIGIALSGELDDIKFRSLRGTGRVYSGSKKANKGSSWGKKKQQSKKNKTPFQLVIKTRFPARKVGKKENGNV